MAEKSCLCRAKEPRTTPSIGRDSWKLVKNFMKSSHQWIFHSNFDEWILFCSTFSSICCSDFYISNDFKFVETHNMLYTSYHISYSIMKHPVSYVYHIIYIQTPYILYISYHIIYHQQCTFLPDDPKTSMELKLLGGNKNG